MKKILAVASILLLTFGTDNALSFDGEYQVKRVEQQETSLPVQIGFTDFMQTEFENEKSAGRILKVPEHISMLLIGSGLLVLGRFGRKRFKSSFSMNSKLPDNGQRRSSRELPQFSYNSYIPERMSGKKRRSGLDNPKITFLKSQELEYED